MNRTMDGENRRLDALERKIALLTVPRGRQADFARYREDPVAFREEILGYPSATRRSSGEPYQDVILQAVQSHSRVAIQAGHGVGKTRVLASLALWWLLPRPYSRVVIVAPQFERQVRGVVFSELARLARRARTPLPLQLLAGQVSVTGYGLSWGIVGLPATAPDRIEGQHAEGGLLLLLDETKGVPQDCFDALMGALTGGEDSRLVVASTPGGTSGPFYRACTDQTGRWKVFRLSAEDSSLVSPAWCADRGHDWGRESPLYQSRVQGEFADAGDGQLFGLALLEHAMGRPAVENGTVTVGVDVARSISGDQNCIAVARGGKVERLVLWRSPDLMATVSRVAQEVAMTQSKTIRVDATGVGSGVVDRLRELRFPVEEVHFGGAASDPTRFRNLRAELFWGLRESLESGAAGLPDDDELVADLVGLRYAFDQAGRVIIEAKDETRRRLGRSPDRADAVALALRQSPAKDQIPLAFPWAGPQYDSFGQPTAGWPSIG